MEQNLKIACIQSELYWEDVSKNLETLSIQIDQVPADVDLIILPEMFSTGFSTHPSKFFTLENEQEVESFLTKISLSRGVAICGSTIVKEGQYYKNRFLFVNEGKITSFYDKKHLFSMGDEHQEFKAGQNQVLIEFKSWKIKPMVCYDLRFPVWIRNSENYDLLIIVANWPEKRNLAWKTLLQARAIENQAYVAGVNRVGTDGNNIPYYGDSMVIQPDGIILESVEKISGIIIQELQREEITKTRRYLPFLKDMDPFELL